MKQPTLSIITCCMLGLLTHACSWQDHETLSGAEVTLEKSVREGSQMREHIKKHNLQLASTRIRLAPDTNRDLRLQIVKGPSAHHLLDAVMKLTGETQIHERSTQDGITRAMTSSYQLKINANSGEHHIALLEKAEALIEKGPLVDEAGAHHIAASLYRQLGVHEDEAVIKVRPLMAAVKQVDKNQLLEINEEGKFVTIDRVIGGIPVPANRIVLLMDLDGMVRHMDGMWTPINYQKSKLGSKATVDNVIDLAIESIHDIDLEGLNPSDFIVSTHYEIIDNGKGDYVLELAGSISVPSDAEGDMASYKTFALP